jgi:hypothetical protein
MYLHKTEDVNTKKVKQLKTQYVYLTINRKATPTIWESVNHSNILDTKALNSSLNCKVFFLHKSLLKRTIFSKLLQETFVSN